MEGDDAGRITLARLRARLRPLWRRWLPSPSQHVFAVTLAVGVVCGVVAVAFHLAIRTAERLLIDRALVGEGDASTFWLVAMPTLGGLVAGILLTYVVPGARGSGIPQVKQAFALEGGRVRVRDAVGKFFIGSLQIGSGASLGREGPTVQVCAGATSLLARLTWLPASDVRRLTPVAAAAGIAAAFNAPIAAVTFTIEEIVGTLDHTVLSGVVVAAALAAVVARGVLGARPVIAVEQQYGLDHPSSLVLYAALGVVAAVASVAFTEGLLALRAWFRTVRRVPAWAHPAVGGLATGVLIAATLKLLGTTGVNGGGYETLSRALAGQLSLKVLLALFVVKIVATIASYSSGGAGGIFAPTLFFGAMLGGAVGHLDVALFHHDQSQLGAFALVGMGAVFAGVIRAPITSVLIIFEMTGSYGLVLPLMLANMTSYALARQWRPAQIYEALLAQDGIVLPHHGERAATTERPIASRKDGVPSSQRAHAERTSEGPMTARTLMAEATIIDASTSIDWIVEERGRRPDAAFVVRDDDDGPFRVVSTELLEEILRDESLPGLLVASEVAVAAPTTAPETALDSVAALLLREGASDAIVIDAESSEPVGVVRRVVVALALMDARAIARASVA